jgi:hypothetical protein
MQGDLLTAAVLAADATFAHAVITRSLGHYAAPRSTAVPTAYGR